MSKLPFKTHPIDTFTSFDATFIKTTLTPKWMSIELGTHVFFFYLDSRPEVAAQESAFFQKVLVEGITGRLSYHPDEGWWMTFWRHGEFRIGWWREMENRTHEFMLDKEESCIVAPTAEKN